MGYEPCVHHNANVTNRVATYLAQKMATNINSQAAFTCSHLGHSSLSRATHPLFNASDSCCTTCRISLHAFVQLSGLPLIVTTWSNIKTIFTFLNKMRASCSFQLTLIKGFWGNSDIYLHQQMLWLTFPHISIMQMF